MAIMELMVKRERCRYVRAIIMAKQGGGAALVDFLVRFECSVLHV